MSFTGRITAILAVVALFWSNASGKDIYVSGRVTGSSGIGIPDVVVKMNTASFSCSATSGTDGYYTLKLSGIYSEIDRQLELGTPFPNPFSHSVNIPFIINNSGDIIFSVYSMAGHKINELSFPGVQAGSYRIIWDGANGAGVPVRQGYYVYAISFGGKTWSGRLIKAAGVSSFSSGSSLVPVMLPPIPRPADPLSLKIPVITSVSCNGYYPVRLTDIIIRRDTVINFELCPSVSLPFITGEDHIEMHFESGYRPLLLKGINLGSSPPGYFPGEIAYAITGAMYEQWIARMAETGFNSIRIYTLHPPVFYEKLAEYNERHPGDPLLLFQGIWLDEIEDGSNPADYDLMLRSESFREGIREVIDCIHGNKSIAFRPGRAYGNYVTNVSRWTAGFIIGREIMPQEVDSTNKFHPSSTSFSGSQLSISGAPASEVFTTAMLDEVVKYEYQTYDVNRPVSMSSWPTLDPLEHPTEIHTDEDVASIDITLINRSNLRAGIFATYHAYPYYPNFISLEPEYQAYSDGSGPNSYLGYLSDLRDHYTDIPLLIGEFGVPSSWGSAHQSFSGMDHGGYSENQQGEKNIRMMHNILSAGCGGGFMFSWMDEWFKRTWIVEYLESYGFPSGEIIIPTRQLWHNLTSPEQNFGLIGFDQTESLPFVGYIIDNPAGKVISIEATHDNSFFYLNAEFSEPLFSGDTVMIAFDTYSAALGESTLPEGEVLSKRAEFLFEFVAGEDTALHYVTEAYDMNGLTPRFNLTDPLVQKYESIVSDGAPWKVMQWINDGFELTRHDIGRLPVESSEVFSAGERSAAAWKGNKLKIRLPWTMLHFNDPTQMKVNDGAESFDGGRSFTIYSSLSDGIAVSVCCKGSVTTSVTRYNWDPWLIVPSTRYREKGSLQVVETGLSVFPRFAD
ncbi:MAG: hypothetical protein JXA55_03050 [Bacteroidales bacterium]|nr:hypothetical protein [Bacteroidales bacterium]